MSAPTIDRGTTVRVQAEVRNAANVLTNPASITCEIIGPTGTTYMAATSMTNSSAGVYLFDRQTAENDPTGIYDIVIRATSASLTSLLKEKGFVLE